MEGIETFLSQIVTLGLEWIWSVSWYWIPAGISIWIIEIQNMGFRNASQSDLKRYRYYFRINNIVVGFEFLLIR